MHGYSSAEFFFFAIRLSHYLLHNECLPLTVCSMNLWRYTSDASYCKDDMRFCQDRGEEVNGKCLLFYYYDQHTTRVERRRLFL